MNIPRKTSTIIGLNEMFLGTWLIIKGFTSISDAEKSF